MSQSQRPWFRATVINVPALATQHPREITEKKRSRKRDEKGGIEAAMNVGDSTQRPKRLHEWVVKLSHRGGAQSGRGLGLSSRICFERGRRKANEQQGEKKTRRRGGCVSRMQAGSAKRERGSRYLAAIGNNKLPSNHRSTTVAVPATAVDRPASWTCERARRSDHAN